MAGKRITDEQKIQINELYLKLGVKSKVAKELGISAASVSKYIIPNYISSENRTIEKFSRQPTIITKDKINSYNKEDFKYFLMHLDKSEKDDIKELQKEIFI